MAPKSVAEKFFDWYDIERILAAIGALPAETPKQILRALRAYEVFARNFRRVFFDAMETLNIRPRDELGNLIWQTTKAIAKIYEDTANSFPQHELELLEDILQEAIEPV